MTEKACSHCKKTKPVSEFRIRGKKADGSDWYESRCLPCKKEYHKQRRNKPLDLNHTYPETRVCYTCKEEKKLMEDFHEADVINGKRTWRRDCKECYNASRRDYIHNRYYKIPGKKDEILKKSREHYYKNHEKNLEYGRKYHEENKERINARHRVSDKEWYKKNAEYKKQYSKERRQDPEVKKREKETRLKYYEENWEREKKRGAEYKKKHADRYLKLSKERYHSDPLYNLKKRLRARTNTAFKRKGWLKNTKTQETLKGSWEEVKDHIENLFEPGMNWDNYSEWDIDHILPLTAAKNEKELIALGHYTNLQPMWASENYSKSDKYDEQDLQDFFEWYNENIEPLS